MATATALLNKVLIGLRQDAIASGTSTITDAYHLLLLQYLNEAKEEVEESWEWQSLRSTVTQSLVASTVEYTISGTNDRSKLLYNQGFHGHSNLLESGSRGFGALPCVWDVTDDGEYRLAEVSWEEIERLHFTDSDETTDRVSRFALMNDGTNLKIKVWPTPSEARTLKLRLYIPEAEAAANSMQTAVTAPARPIYALALWKANAERGEEIAAPGGFAESAYRKALTDAIAREMTYVDITSFPV
ncbi:MAG: hypothetical protein ACYSW8_28855 [Planctomycetota bacterium]|jgi:hypothetical protein